jgi:hypothetical protein
MNPLCTSMNFAMRILLSWETAKLRRVTGGWPHDARGASVADA